MLFEHYLSQDIMTPAIIDGGVNKLNFSLTSLDFYLLDDINAYLTPIQTKKNKHDLINESKIDNSQHQEEVFSDLDFPDFNEFDEKSEFLAASIPIDDLDIEKWISESSFPSPPMETNNSFLSNIEDTSSRFTWMDDEYTKNTDMIVPLSPPLSLASSSPASSSSSGSSPASSIKKQKLTAVERKLRKKSQNKTAAEKYRVKKKSERNQLGDRHLQLRSINKELKSELENLTYRVQQFKQLFAEFLQIDLSTPN